MSEESNETSCRGARLRHYRFIVTGFGPFQNVPENPTSTLIHRLQIEEDWGLMEVNDMNSSDISRLSHARPILQETHVLETSAEYVRLWLDNLQKRLVKPEMNKDTIPAAGSCEIITPTNTTTCLDEDDIILLLLHLGVDHNSTQFKLEQCAYNDATFRVPDERGYQPQRECVLPPPSMQQQHDGENSLIQGRDYYLSSAWGQCLQTTIDLNRLCEELQKCTHEKVVISTDPGRFVCNYTYYSSLYRCHHSFLMDTSIDTTKSSHENNTPNDHSKWNEEGEFVKEMLDKPLRSQHALFLHVPPFEVVNEERQLMFVRQVMKLMLTFFL